MQLRHSVLLALTLTACNTPVAVGTGTEQDTSTAPAVAREEMGGPDKATEYRLSCTPDETGQIAPYGRLTAIAPGKAILDHWPAPPGTPTPTGIGAPFPR